MDLNPKLRLNLKQQQQQKQNPRLGIRIRLNLVFGTFHISCFEHIIVLFMCVWKLFFKWNGVAPDKQPSVHHIYYFYSCVCVCVGIVRKVKGAKNTGHGICGLLLGLRMVCHRFLVRAWRVPLLLLCTWFTNIQYSGEKNVNITDNS